jgi:hypothetical protein
MAMPDQNRKERLLRYLEPHRGFVFRWQRWRMLRADWSHDHCKGCWARFSEFPESRDDRNYDDRNYNEGWVTLWPVHDPAVPTDPVSSGGFTYVPSPKPGGFQLDWFCPECFEAVREELQFVVDAEHPRWKRAGCRGCSDR